MSEENKENRINVEDLPQAERELTDEEAKDVKGGIGILLPAVQKVREAAAATTTAGDTDSNNLVQGNLIGTD